MKKNEEPDEERLTKQDNDDNTYVINQLKQDLSESKNEVKQLSEQVRNLKNREQSLDAENKIMKS